MKLNKNHIVGSVLILVGLIATPFVLNALMGYVVGDVQTLAKKWQCEGDPSACSSGGGGSGGGGAGGGGCLVYSSLYGCLQWGSVKDTRLQTLAKKWQCEGDPSACSSGGGGSGGGGGGGRCIAYSSLYGCLQWGSIGGGRSATMAFLQDYGKQSNGQAWLANIAKSKDSSLALGFSGASAANPDDSSCDTYINRANAFMKKAFVVTSSYKSDVDPSNMDDDDFVKLSTFVGAADEAMRQYLVCSSK